MTRTSINSNNDNNNDNSDIIIDNHNIIDNNNDMEKIFLEISKNWNELEENEIVKEMIDMKTNNLCKQMKNDNPHLRNSYIQSLVFTFIYTMNINLNNANITNIMSEKDKN